MLGANESAVNVNGGSVALGHALGSTGVRMVVTLIHELRRRGDRLRAVTLCGRGGQDEASSFALVAPRTLGRCVIDRMTEPPHDAVRRSGVGADRGCGHGGATCCACCRTTRSRRRASTDRLRGAQRDDRIIVGCGTDHAAQHSSHCRPLQCLRVGGSFERHARTERKDELGQDAGGTFGSTPARL